VPEEEEPERELPTEPVPRVAEALLLEREEAETPERLTLEARVADVALEADAARVVPDALLRFTEEERTEVPVRDADAERVSTLVRADALRETEDPERTATLPSL
jgi:hypothetical protein